MTLIDINHPFYRPLWVRLLIVCSVSAWAGVEWYNHEPFWGTVTGGIAIYCAYTLLIAFKPKSAEPAKQEPPSE